MMKFDAIVVINCQEIVKMVWIDVEGSILAVDESSQKDELPFFWRVTLPLFDGILISIWITLILGKRD
jgi:hypothetical protein